MSLTRKQHVWLEEYLTCWNATEAARRAGYKHANKVGPQLLVHLGIREALTARIAEKAMAADEVLARLAEHARGDLGVFFKVVETETEAPLPSQEILGSHTEPGIDGNPIRVYTVRQVAIDLDKMLDPTYSRLVKKFSDSPKTGLSVELYDAQAALVHLGKHLKVFSEEGPGNSLRREYVGVDVNAV